MEANILVTFDPNHAGKAKDIIKKALPDAEMLETHDGAVLLNTERDPKKAVKELAKECKNNPSKFAYTFHWTPLEIWCAADMKDMQNAMEKINKKIDPAATWKLEINKRAFHMPMTELIEKLAECIEKPKVDLKKPDQVVHVEIIGGKTAVSLLRPEEMLNVKKMVEES